MPKKEFEVKTETDLKPLQLDVPPMKEDSTHQVIGKLPKKGQKITINGLVYETTFVDVVKGLFHAKINRI